MKQLLQSLRTGEAQVADVPAPQPRAFARADQAALDARGREQVDVRDGLGEPHTEDALGVRRLGLDVGDEARGPETENGSGVVNRRGTGPGNSRAVSPSDSVATETVGEDSLFNSS